MSSFFLLVAIPVIATVALGRVVSAASTQPAPADAAVPEPRQLFLETVERIQKAQQVAVKVQRHYSAAPVKEVATLDEQMAATGADDETDFFAISRPDRVRFDREPNKVPEVNALTIHEVMTGSRLWMARQKRKAGDSDGT